MAAGEFRLPWQGVISGMPLVDLPDDDLAALTKALVDR